MSTLFAKGQEPHTEKSVRIIDSLVYYNHFAEADQKIDHVKSWLSKQKKDNYILKIGIQLDYYSAHIHAVNFENSQALKIALECIRLAKKYNLPEWEFKSLLFVACLYEQSKDLLPKCANVLDESYKVYNVNKLEYIYSTYCIRKSSYYRFVGNKDSTLFFASKALDFAKKYDHKRDQIDALLLLGIFYQKTNYKKTMKYASAAAHEMAAINNRRGAANQYLNISTALLSAKQFNQANLYADSAYMYLSEFKDKGLPPLKYFELKHQIYFAKGQLDSAYFYLKELNSGNLANRASLDKVEVSRIAEKYESEKKEQIIKNKNLQVKLIICILIVTAVATLLVLRKNRKIKLQNKIIKDQLNELNEVLTIKKILLSELQHRVKNNLQNIMSILEIQKESADFSNIDELIRANRNRVQSMVLLHQRLEISEDLNHIKAEKYITELAFLVRDSYVYLHKNIQITTQCYLDSLPIDHAQPLGMIMVELISNSCKHAFKNKKNGSIQIYLGYDSTKRINIFRYEDNGIGFDAEKQNNDKGLGFEIIYGLINQLNGTSKIDTSKKGFHMSIHF